MALRLSYVALVMSAATPLAAAAQDSATVQAQNAWFYNAAGGSRIARMQRGARLAVGRRQGDWQEVVAEGWIFRPSVSRTSVGGFDLEVTQSPNENLRIRPNQRILARLERGFLLNEIERSRNWVHVRRVGWMRRSILDLPDGSAPASTTPAVEPESAALSLSRAGRAVALLSTPSGDTTASIDSGRVVKVLERSQGWVRVQLDGWLRESELEDPGVLTAVTPAELREDPELYVGKIVRWRLQYIGVRTADELRPDIPLGQRYLLARGPLPASEYVYVIIPEDRVAEVEALHPLTVVTIDGRIVTPQTRYLGNTVLDLLRIESKAAP